MIVVISTGAVRKKFLTALSRELPFDRWLVTSRVPGEKDIAVLAEKHGIRQATVLVFTKYGRVNAAQFPPVCGSGMLVSLFFYRTLDSIACWIDSLREYRAAPTGKALVMAMMKPLYVKWADTCYSVLAAKRYGAKKTARHLPETTTNIELAGLLSRGCALAVYVGHGRSRGWSGYRGFRWRHIEQFEQKRPVGTMVSLSCSSLKQDKNESIPFGIQRVMEGRDCTFLGAAESVKIPPLEEITQIMLDCLACPEITRVDQLVLRMNEKILSLPHPDTHSTWLSFRLIGNPLQPL